MANYTVNFIRHGEHKGDCVAPELTVEGVAEARAIGNDLAISNVDSYTAFTINRPRFLGTVALAMLPHLDVEEIETTFKGLVKEGRIILDDDLDYRPMSNARFKAAMMTAFNSGRAMDFLVNESDRYLPSRDLSTYRTMSRLMARRILLTTDNSIYCAKELMTSSLRARITSMCYGQEVLKDYVDWYMSNIEWNPKARKHVIRLQTDGNEYLLSDGYGEISFDRRILTSIGERDDE